MDAIYEYIRNNDWYSIVDQFTPEYLSDYLKFKNGFYVSYKMLFNDEGDDNLRDYAFALLQAIRRSYPKEWSEDWRNDVFLGDACYMMMKHEEQYEAYKRAYEKVVNPPSSLLISLASCYLVPKAPITLEEAENLAKKALEKEISIEGVVLLRGIYAEKNDQSNFDYWDRILREIEKKDIHTKEAWPNIHFEYLY